MVRCVVVEKSEIEDVRQDLSERNIIRADWKIDTDSDYGYIPIDPSATVEYDTINRDLEQRQDRQTVSEILGYQPTYEWLGDIVLLNEDEHISEIVDAFRQLSRSPKTILNKSSNITGTYRTREWDTVYGDDTETVHTEYGYEYKLDIDEVYFTQRLATERNYVTDKIDSSETVIDMFAGVGPYTIPAADTGASVIAVDINPVAVSYLRENIERNSVSDNVTMINDDVRSVSGTYSSVADTVIMNLPMSANEFISTAYELVKDGGRLFYYDFCSEETTTDDIVQKVQQEVSDVASFNVAEYREVRPYAKGIYNVCAEITVNKQ